jgi:hypothetical protein
MQKQNEGHGLKFCCRIWLGIGFLVKTFNREDDEEIDINEVIKLLEDGDDCKLEEQSS